MKSAVDERKPADGVCAVLRDFADAQSGLPLSNPGVFARGLVETGFEAGEIGDWLSA
jgi:hypothetical protein